MTTPAHLAPGSGARRPGPGERPRSYKTEALVLRSIPTLEADRLLTLLTPGLGTLRVSVRGARRITSKLAGHVGTLNRAQLTLALGHTFDVVTGAEALETFPRLKADLERTATALYLAELAGALVPEHAPHPNAYALLLAALRALDGEAPLSPLLARYVELRLLEDGGFLPELGRCVVCGRSVEPGHHRFAPVAGGLVCDDCQPGAGRVLDLSVDALKVLRHFARSGLAEGARVAVGERLAQELEGLLAASLHAVLEREPASAGFLDHLARLRRGL